MLLTSMRVSALNLYELISPSKYHASNSTKIKSSIVYTNNKIIFLSNMLEQINTKFTRNNHILSLEQYSIGNIHVVELPDTRVVVFSVTEFNDNV